MIEQKTGWSADEVLDAGRHPGHHARRGRRPGAATRRGRRSSVPAADRASPPSSRPASATRSVPASSPRSPGGSSLEHAAAGGLRARGVRRGDGRPAGLHVHRRAVPRPAGRVLRRRRRPKSVRPHLTRRSGEPPHQVARHAVVGGVLADVLLAAHPAPRRDVVGRGRVGRDHGDDLTDLDLADPLAQLDDRQRADACPRQSSSQVGGHSPASARISATTSGSTARNAVHVCLGGVAGQRDPDVAVGECAHRRQHVAGLQRGGGAGRTARRPRSRGGSSASTIASPST